MSTGRCYPPCLAIRYGCLYQRTITPQARHPGRHQAQGPHMKALAAQPAYHTYGKATAHCTSVAATNPLRVARTEVLPIPGPTRIIPHSPRPVARAMPCQAPRMQSGAAHVRHLTSCRGRKLCRCTQSHRSTRTRSCCRWCRGHTRRWGRSSHPHTSCCRPAPGAPARTRR